MNPARVEYIRQKVCFPSIPVDRDRGHDRLPTLGSASTPDLAPGESSRSTAADSANQVSSFFSFLAGSGSSGSRPSLSPAINAKSTDGEPEWTFETRHADVERSRSAGTGNWLAGKRIVDVGCGGGLLSESLARLGGNVIGVDASEANINIARIHAARDPFLPYVGDEMGATSPQTSGMPSRHRGGGSLEYRCTSAESLRDAGEKFDLVCSMEVLEHVDQPGEFLKCLGDMVKVSQTDGSFISLLSTLFCGGSDTPPSLSLLHYETTVSPVRVLGFALDLSLTPDPARWPPAPLHHLPHPSLPSSYPHPGRNRPPPRYTWNTYIQQICETARTPPIRLH